MSGDEPTFEGFENVLMFQEFSNLISKSGVRRKRDECGNSEMNLSKKSRDMKKKGKGIQMEDVPFPDDSMLVDSSDDSDIVQSKTKTQSVTTPKTNNMNPNRKTEAKATETVAQKTIPDKPHPKKHNLKDEYKNSWTKNTSDTVFFIERQETQDKTTPVDTRQSKPIHPMELAKILYSCGIKEYRELKMAGNGRFRISFDRPRQAEALINSKLLKEEFKLHIYVPNMMKESIGVVRSVPPSLTDAEILENTLAGTHEIVKVERILKRMGEELIPTYSIKIYIKGQELPKQVTIFGVPAKVTVYVFPLRMCFNCCRYGHTAKACKSKTPRCMVCTLEHDGRNCKATPRCCHCSGQHKTNDPECPERIRQDKIRYLMASEKLTFIEASFRFPKKHSVQHRLNSIEDFPLLSNSDTNNVIQDMPNHTETKQSNTELPQSQISNQNFHKIVQQVKSDLIKQLNLDTIIKKMKTIQDTIVKYSQQHKKHKDSIDSDILLIKISDQINEIIEPEVKTRSDAIKQHNNG